MLKSRVVTGRGICLTMALTIVLVSGLVACSSSASSTPVPTAPPGGSTAQSVTIEMINTAFNPKSVEIKAGTAVVWVNKDPAGHSTTSDSGLWDSGVMPQGGTFSYTFTQPGTYPYHCTPHLALGMTGVITVVQ